MSSRRQFTRVEIEQLIEDGNALVICDGHVLQLTKWQLSHPGGPLAIQHMVGRDATDEISVYHSLSTLKSMKAYRIGRIVQPWINIIPPIQRKPAECTSQTTHEKQASEATDRTVLHPNAEQNMLSEKSLQRPSSTSKTQCIHDMIHAEVEADLRRYPSLDVSTQTAMSVKFKDLHERVQREGFYDLDPSAYAADLARYVVLFLLFLFCLRGEQYIASACFLGLFWHQIMFTAHDAGHLGITHNFVIDNLIGIFIGNFCSGLSIGWWKSSHNVHHLITNDPVHDPDIQNVPFFATSPAFFGSISSTYYNGFCFVWDKFADIAVQYQRYTYYPVMAVARFNLYALSWAHLLQPKRNSFGRVRWIRPVEIAATSCYLVLFGYVLLYRNIPTWSTRAMFLVISHVITMPLHVQITLSHWGTSTADLGPNECFAQRQLRTTADVACPAWLDCLHGGLQFQVEHHLFPRVPRHNLRRLRSIIQDFCLENKTPHLMFGFLDGNRGVLSKLQDVADQVTVLSGCASHNADVWSAQGP